MRPFSAIPSVKSPATTCTSTTEQGELIVEIKEFLEENLVDEIQLEFKEWLDHFYVSQKKTKQPLRGILKRRESKPTAAGGAPATGRKLPNSLVTIFSKGLDNKTSKKSTVRSPATTCTPTTEQGELIGEIKEFLEESLADEIELSGFKELLKDFFDVRRTKEPFRGIQKKGKLVLRKGLK